MEKPKQQRFQSAMRDPPTEPKGSQESEFSDEEEGAVASKETDAELSGQGVVGQSSGTGIYGRNPCLAIIKEASSEKWRRLRIVSVYFVTVALLFADMNLMAPNLTEIADEFGFDDTERDVKLGGLIALAFFFVGAPVSFLIGWLADSVRRSPLYAATVLFGEAACLATYFVRTFPQLLVTRTMTGISVGGAIPVIYSVLGDLYPAKQRAAVSALIFTGTGLGAGLGQALAGFLGEKYGWRLPFLVVSIPAFWCAGFLFCIKDPERGAKEAAKLEMDQEIMTRKAAKHQKEGGQDESNFQDEDASILTGSFASPKGRKARVIQSEQSKFQDIVQNENAVDLESEEPESADATGNETGLSSAFDRNNAEHEIIMDEPTLQQSDERIRGNKEKKVSWKTTWQMLKAPSVALTIIQAAPGALPFGFGSVFLNDYLQENRGMTKAKATGILMTFGVGNAIGVISGGLLGHKAYKRDQRSLPILMGTSLIASCIPFYLLVNVVNSNTSIASASTVAVFSGIFAAFPVPVERAILANVTVPESRGRANSLLSIVDDLGKGLGPAIVSLMIAATDRQTACNLSLIGWIVAGILSFMVGCFVKVDEQRVQEKIRLELEKEELSTEGEDAASTHIRSDAC